MNFKKLESYYNYYVVDQNLEEIERSFHLTGQKKKNQERLSDSRIETFWLIQPLE